MHLSDLAHPPVYRSIDECRVEVIWDRMRFDEWQAEYFRKNPGARWRYWLVGIWLRVDEFLYRIWRWVGLRRDWVDAEDLDRSEIFEHWVQSERHTGKVIDDWDLPDVG